MSTRGDILAALAARLAKITTANGYATNVKKVYYDEIPMGLELAEHELPAIFCLDRDDVPQLEHGVFKGNWQVKLQLWHNPNPDSTMLDFVRDVFKVIYSDHPASQVRNMFKVHPRVVEITPSAIASDLNMIEANRVYEVGFIVQYRTELFNL